ncbi:hypothetical protein LOK49_LG09G00371 [Camellia lanceoleosa]|uniref:Uncharacterized protein n=1 Tax=Camellia lanceoleosa TaxID=1840588 RepID=A0ACC0GEF2_9ERIC|nr:hypothetical protein LOK49_LG09G00371 [Camellia lanceoleosa]
MGGEQSAFDLTVTLCLPTMSEALAMNKLVAGFTMDVEELAYHYAMEGKLIELAVLLIVAQEKVLVPITFHGKDGAGLNGSMTIHECLRNQCLSLINEEINLMDQVEHEKLTRIHNKKTIMKLAMVLLEVFERAGSSIEEYHQLQLQQPDMDISASSCGYKLMFDRFLQFCNDLYQVHRYTRLEDKSSQLWSPHLPMQQQNKCGFSPKERNTWRW